MARYSTLKIVRTVSVALTSCAILAGCATSQLRNLSINQGETITNFEYRMALDNLAMFRIEENSIPWHVVLSSGTTQLDESAAPTYSSQWTPWLSTVQIAPTVDMTVNWSLAPELRGPILLLIQQEYQTAAKGTAFECNYYEAKTAPEDGIYGQFGDEYVWPRKPTEPEEKCKGTDPYRLDQLIIKIATDITNWEVANGAATKMAPSPNVALSPKH